MPKAKIQGVLGLACSSKLVVVVGKQVTGDGRHELIVEFYDLELKKSAIVSLPLLLMIERLLDYHVILTLNSTGTKLAVASSLGSNVYLFNELDKKQYQYTTVDTAPILVKIGFEFFSGKLPNSVQHLVDNVIFSGDDQFLLLQTSVEMQWYSLKEKRIVVSSSLPLSLATSSIWISHDNSRYLVIGGKNYNSRYMYEKHQTTTGEQYVLISQPPREAAALSTRGIELSGTTGVAPTAKHNQPPPPPSETQLLLAAKGEVRGKPAIYKDPATVLEERNGQILLTTNERPELVLLEAGQRFIVNAGSWMVSMVRRQGVVAPATPPATTTSVASATTASSASKGSQGRDSDRHVFLVLQGVERKLEDDGKGGKKECFYTVTKEIHFFLDESRPAGPLQQSFGLIQVNDISPYNLEALAPQCVCKSWNIEPSDAEALLRNIEKDRASSTTAYSLRGQYAPTFFRGHNCLTWCEEHLKKIGIKDVPTSLLDFVVAVPSRHLPAPDANSCSVM